eukprot:764000-Hanusia_phi.AAC.5
MMVKKLNHTDRFATVSNSERFRDSLEMFAKALFRIILNQGSRKSFEPKQHDDTSASKTGTRNSCFI